MTPTTVFFALVLLFAAAIVLWSILTETTVALPNDKARPIRKHIERRQNTTSKNEVAPDLFANWHSGAPRYGIDVARPYCLGDPNDPFPM